MLNRIFCLTIALLMVGSLFSVAQAAEFTYPAGKVDLVCPEGWAHELNDARITMTAPDSSISFIFNLLDGDTIEMGLEEAIKGIVEALGPTTFGEPEKDTINGMEVTSFEGTCEAKGVSVMLSIINTPADKALCMYYFGAKAAEEANSKAIAEIVNGIKPSTEAAVEATVEGEEEVEEGTK